MTAPTSPREDATVRGAIVLVVAIVIGLALLARGGGADDAATTTTRDTSATTEFTGGTTSAPTGDTLPPGEDTTLPSTPTDTRVPSEVTVIVLNGTETVGLAADFESKASAAGYGTLTSANAATNTDTTTIYAPQDLSADAAAVAAVLGVPDAAVAPIPSDPLGRNGEDAEADIVVVLGSDAPQS